MFMIKHVRFIFFFVKGHSTSTLAEYYHTVVYNIYKTQVVNRSYKINNLFLIPFKE